MSPALRSVKANRRSRYVQHLYITFDFIPGASERIECTQGTIWRALGEHVLIDHREALRSDDICARKARRTVICGSL